MRRPSPAVALSVIAVFLAFSGGAIAAQKIGGKQIVDGSITGKDVKNRSLTPSDIKGGLRRGPRGARGSQGVTGPAGPAGPTTVAYRSVSTPIPAQSSRNVRASCPAGQVPTGGGYIPDDVAVGIAFSIADDANGDTRPDSWLVTAVNVDAATQHTIIVEVMCVAATTVTTH